MVTNIRQDPYKETQTPSSADSHGKERGNKWVRRSGGGHDIQFNRFHGNFLYFPISSPGAVGAADTKQGQTYVLIFPGFHSLDGWVTGCWD